MLENSRDLNVLNQVVKTTLVIFLGLLYGGCSDSNDFTSGAAKNLAPKQETENRALELPVDEKKEVKQVQASSKSGTGYSKNLVEQGIFKVWSVPASPKSRQDYLIYIEVGNITPEELSTFKLSGEVNGTDGFYDTFGPATPARRSAESDKVFFIEIPGGAQKVKDQIYVKYNDEDLGEFREDIELTFGI